MEELSMIVYSYASAEKSSIQPMSAHIQRNVHFRHLPVPILHPAR